MNHTVLALVLLSACAPARSDVPEGSAFSNDYTSALFAVETSSYGGDYDMGKLFLADADLTCDDLDARGEMSSWRLDPGVPYVALFVRHGAALDGWLRDYPALERAQQDGTDVGREQMFFWGELGEANNGDLPPYGGPVISLGIGAAEVDDLLSVGRSNDQRLSGRLDYADGTIAYDAQKCGAFPSTGF